MRCSTMCEPMNPPAPRIVIFIRLPHKVEWSWRPSRRALPLGRHRRRGGDTIGRGTIKGIRCEPQTLKDHMPDEQRIVPEVPPPEPPRLLVQPEQPFEPAALHPPRRLGLQAGVKIERGADPNAHGRGQAVAVLMHPPFLFRRAQ